MQNTFKSKAKRKSSLSAWRLLIILVLVLGIFFRLTNLDRKVYWFDETYTSLRISGYQERELIEEVYNGKPIAVKDLLKYQQLESDRNVNDVLDSLAKEDPQHSPLYYLLTHFWVRWFGNSIAVVRSLGAVVSLLAFPAMYWLAWELFNSTAVANMAMAILAVSPFHILYAQEARPYGMWTVTILLSSAAFLRAIRLKTITSWFVYTLTLFLGFYTFLYTALVALGHGIYLVAIEKFRFTKTVVSYIVSWLLAILCFSPWLLIIVDGLDRIKQATAYLNERGSIAYFLKAWLGRIGYIFVDLNPYSPDSKISLGLFFQYLLGFLTIALAVYSIYCLIRFNSIKVWLFVLTLISSTWLTLLCLDLSLGGTRSTINRYLIPCFIGIQLAVAYLLSDRKIWKQFNRFFLSTKGDRVNQNWHRRKTKRLWQIIAIFIFSCGILSATISSYNAMWWNKGANYYVPAMAKIIDRAERPLVITDNRTENQPLTNISGDIISLSYLLKPETYIQLVVKPNIPEIPSNFKEIFVFNSSENLRHNLQQQGYQFELIYQTNNPVKSQLFKLSSKRSI
jgi:uncharacterized membrane protein